MMWIVGTAAVALGLYCALYYWAMSYMPWQVPGK